MNKYIRYGLLVVVVGLLAYKSVYFDKLSARKISATNDFDATAFSKKLWDERMPAKIDSAVQLSALIDAITKDGEAAINKYANALAIGNYRYALVRLAADVVEIKEDEVMLGTRHNDLILTVNLATEFVYGNAIRDASDLVHVKDYPNTSDLNGISEALNKIIRTTVLPSFKSAVKKGDKVDLVGAIELNKEHLHWDGIELLPVQIQIIQ